MPTLAVGLLSAATAHWQMVYADFNERHYIDTETIRVEGTLVYDTNKVDLLSPSNAYKLLYGDKVEERWVERVEDCSNNSAKILHLELKDADGNDVIALTTPSEVTFVPIIPGTSDEADHRFVCSRLIQAS